MIVDVNYQIGQKKNLRNMSDKNLKIGKNGEKRRQGRKNKKMQRL